MAETILIVDDDTDTIDFLSLVLTRQGYAVISATTGAQAVAIATDEHPDLIILDIMMPEMNGYQVARQLRATPDLTNIPLMMYTARAQLEDKVEGYEAGVDLYLVKPVHPIELQANIRTLLTRRKVTAVEKTPVGYTLGIVTPKGGMGASTLALNLALAYYKYTKARVIAAEMRPGQGTWAQELNLPDADNLCRLLRLDVDAITPEAVEGLIVPTLYDIRLLLASSVGDYTGLCSAVDQHCRIVEILAHLAPLTILDIGTSLLPAFPEVVKRCNELLVITEPQPGSVKRAAQLIKDIKMMGFGISKPIMTVVLSRARVDMAMTIPQIEDIIGVNVVLGIPAAPEQAFHAATRSVPITSVQPDGLMAQQYEKLAQHLARRVTGRR